MKLNTYEAPHIRHQETTRILTLDMVLVLLFIYGMAFFYYGPRVLALGAVSVCASVACDILCTLIAGRKPNIRDYSPVVTGMLLPLLMPASIPYHVAAVAAVFGIAVAKHPFGGVGHNVFNPAAAGFSFATICFAEQLFLYPLPRNWLPVFSQTEATLVNSPAFTLSVGGIPGYDPVEMLLGNYPGPMGATNILVLVACLLYLVLRNTVRWEIPVFFFAAVCVIAFAFPRAEIGPGPDVLLRVRLLGYELMSGYLLFGGAFLLSDPVTTPKRDAAKIAYAVAAGIVVMLFRRYGGFEDTFPFAVLIMNATVWGFDMTAERLARLLRHRRTAHSTH